MLKILNRAPSYQLTTKAAVKADLGISDATHDAVLDRMIDAASDAARGFTNRSFAAERIREVVSGQGDEFLSLRRTPLHAIVSVISDGMPIVDYDFDQSDRDAGLLYRKNRWDWGAPLQRHTVERYRLPGREERKYAVDYRGGYLLPDITDALWAAVASSVVGTFQGSEGLTFAPSSASGTFTELIGSHFRFVLAAGTPADSDTVTGGTSGATATVGSPAPELRLPADVEEAVRHSVKLRFQMRDSTRSGPVSSVKTPVLSVTFQEPLKRGGTVGLAGVLSDDALSALARHVRAM